MEAVGIEVQNIQFPLLQHLSRDELQKILDDDDRALSFLEEHINTKKQTKEMIIVENRSLADFNLSRETRLLEGRQRLIKLYEDNRRAREVYDTNKRSFDEHQGQWSIPAAKVMLETGATKTEEESEEIANDYIDGQFAVEEFLEKFQNIRTQAHIQRIQADKMAELVKRLGDYQNIEITPNRTIPYPIFRPVPPTPTGQMNSGPVPQMGNPTHISPMSIRKPMPAPRNLPMYQPGYPQGSVGASYQY